MNLYDTRVQLAAIEQLPREYSWLFDTFVRDMGVVQDTKAIWDYRKGSRKMAPIVHNGTGGVLMEREGYETREVGFCTIAPERTIENPDLTGRMFGEKILGAKTPAQREKEIIVRDLMEMRAAIQRRKEWMARQVLLTGKLDVFRYTNEGRDAKTTLIADYGFTNNFTPTPLWSNASAKIDANMRDIYDMVYEGLGVVDVIVMAPDVADAMLNNSSYVKLFDMRNVDMGEINTRYRGQGVRFVGHNSDGVEMYSFSGKYTDDDGTVKPILPSGTLIAGSRGMLKCMYGPVTQVEKEGMDSQHVTYAMKEVPLRYGSIESGTVKHRLTSCPTIIPDNVDGWVVAHVL